MRGREERGREEWEGGEGERRGREEGEKAYNHYMFTFILPSYSKRISVALNETNVPAEKQHHSCETQYWEFQVVWEL